MSQDAVSPRQGHDALVGSDVTGTPALSLHRSSPRPTLFSQYRGPFIYNETDDERNKREEDEAKRTNFDKVRDKAEREEAGRKAAEAERDQLRKEKEEREAADRKAEQEKLAAEGKLKELAEAKEAEAQAKAAEAAAEKAKREEAEKELAEFKKAQQEELDALLKEIPEADRPPLDDSMTVPARIKLLKYAKAQIEARKGKRIGAGQRNEGGDGGTSKEELLDKMRKGPGTQEDALELMATAEE